MERVADETRRTVLFNVTFGQKLNQKLNLSSNEHSKKLCPNMRSCRFNWLMNYQFQVKIDFCGWTIANVSLATETF
jgi:hypothetical protein